MVALLLAGKWEADTIFQVLEGDLQALQFSRINDLVYIVHPSYPPVKLARIADDNWTWEEVVWEYPPTLEENIEDVTRDPSATSGSITITASADTFQADHVGSYRVIGHRRENAYVSVLVNSGTATSSALHVQGEWELTRIGNWQGTLNLQRRKIGNTGGEAIRTWSDANATNWPSFDDVALYAAAAPTPTPTSTSSPSPTPTPTRSPTPQPTPEIGSNLDLTGFRLVFADNFNTLSVQSPDDKGSAIWLGHGPYGAASNFSKSQWSWDRRTLRVENGVLVNTAWWDESINNWRSGLISSMDRQGDGFAQRFGYWEARMRMPDAGRGAVPAFWLLAATTIPNHTGIKGYEIDILEWFGKDAPQIADRFAHTIHEWNPDGPDGPGSEGRWVDVADPINTWHTYGCMVTPWWIAFYLDGVCTWTKPVNLDYNNSPLYVMVNYALGGGWPVTGEPYASHGDSALLVDYVYAYAPPAAWPIPQTPNHSLSNAGFESDADGAHGAAGWREWSSAGSNSNGLVVEGESHGGTEYL